MHRQPDLPEHLHAAHAVRRRLSEVGFVVATTGENHDRLGINLRDPIPADPDSPPIDIGALLRVSLTADELAQLREQQAAIVELFGWERANVREPGGAVIAAAGGKTARSLANTSRGR